MYSNINMESSIQAADFESDEEVEIARQQMMVTDLYKADPKAIRFAVDRFKELGNASYKQKKYSDAIEYYNQAIAGDSNDKTLFSNRSAANLCAGLYGDALVDAQRAIALDDSWPKAYYRLGCAYMSLNQWKNAATALEKAASLDSSNSDIQSQLAIASKRVSDEQAALRAAAAVERRSLVLKLREARHADQKMAMLNQFKQSMTAPDWELEDLEWRPTWMPSMRFHALDVDKYTKDPKKSALLGYVSALSDLSYPKRALATLADISRFNAYDAAIKNTAHNQHVLVLSGGGTGAVLALMAARAGAQHVTLIERSRMLYRMAKQILTANESAIPESKNIDLVPSNLKQVKINEHLTERGNNDVSNIHFLPSPPTLIVTDLFDHTILGCGLIPSLEYIAQNLMTPDHSIDISPSSCMSKQAVLPCSIRIFAVLVDVQLDGQICGFDLSPLDDAYRWYPGHESVDVDKISHKRLSEPNFVHEIDLEGVLKMKRKEARRIDKTESDDENNAEIAFIIAEKGEWNAIMFWFELDLGHGAGKYVSSNSPSWGHAIQYVDKRPVQQHDVISLRVQQDAGQIVFITNPPQYRLHHAIAPRWHFDMVQDTIRNDAYDAAIRRAICQLKNEEIFQNSSEENKLMVLDIGAGTGLLSMMAVRAGADEAFAVEVSAHMCDVAEETTILNGFLGKILVLDRDVRRMDTVAKPDGTAPELPRRVDMAVFEIFDSGLIGEGVLHSLTAAKTKLLTPNALLVPFKATVYAQPIEMRLDEVLGIDVSQANRWRWRPDYEGLELSQCREKWKGLGEPQVVFEFNFYEVEKYMSPQEVQLHFDVIKQGTVNAIAMWFDLHLDDRHMLSTNPYLSKGPTWQQAVQWMPEVWVSEGDILPLQARHDTYSISFEPLYKDTFESIGIPLVDPVWKVSYDALQGINSQLVRACVQNPLEYRAAALAAVQFASRSQDLGLDATQASEYCMKMMG